MRHCSSKNRLSLVPMALLLCFLGFVGSGLASEPFAPGFGSGGISEIHLPLEDRGLFYGPSQGPLITDLAVTPRGGFVAAVGSGTESGFFSVARFNARGGLDERFGSNGFVEAEEIFPSLIRYTGPQAESVAMQRDGKIVVVGYRTESTSDTPAPVLMRLLPNGKPDRTFAHRGVIGPKPDGTRADALHAVAVQPGGRIVAVGARNERDEGAIRVRRPAGLVVAYRPDGRIDRSFGKAGRVFFRGAKERNEYTGLLDLAILPSNKILIVGYRNSRLLVVRLQAGGEPDPSFGGGDGIVSVDPENGNFCCPHDASLFVLDDGRTVALTDGLGRVLMVGLLPDGKLDPRFGRRGIVRTSEEQSAWIHAVAVQGNGRIVAVGQGSSGGRGFSAQRFMPDGSRDRSFGRRGFLVLPHGRAGSATSAVTLPNGQVVLGGGAQYRRSDHFDYSLLLAQLR